MNLENESEERQDFSEEGNDLNSVNVKLKKKKFLDSDSEVDEPAPEGINESIKQFASNRKQNPEKSQNSADGSTNALNEIENEISDKLTSGFHSEFEAKVDNDEGVLNIEVKRKKKSKRIAILDSDSEDELNTKEVDSKIDVDQSSNPLENHKFSKGTDNIRVSKENQNENYEGDIGITGDYNEYVKWKRKPKRIAIIDSDSEDEVAVTPHNKSFNDELNTPQMRTSSDLVAENNSEELRDNVIKKSSFAALCDSESSEDENRYPSTSEESTLKNQKRAKTLKKSTSKRSTQEPPEKKMTAKQALQQRQEIRSESQRMLRESRVSLPYHKPKAHSIKEFLQNRPRLSLSMLKTENTPPSVAMKMSVQELEFVTKKLEEREKVVQEFYKSESESDDEDVQSKDTSTVQREENCDDNKEMVENNIGANEDKEMEIVENDELLTHSEDEGSAIIYSKSKEEEEIKDVVQSKNISEANLETSKMDISEKDTGASEEIDHVKEHQEIHGTTNGTENQMNTDISATDLLDEPMMLKGNDEHKVPEEENSELENINICEEEANTYKVQEEPATSLEELEISSIISNENNQEIEETNNRPNSVIEHCEDSVDFDFNLDGLDQNLSENFAEDAESNCKILEKNSEQKERDTEEEHLQRLLKKYEDNLDNDCINPATTPEKKKNKTDLLKQIGATKPCLSGGPDEVIDLDEDITKPSGVVQLMERFMKHALTKSVVKNKVQLDVINLTQGEVVKETVAMSVDPEEEPILDRPGMKLKKLRDELQSQIAQRRSDLWHQKHQPLCESSNKDTSDDEKSDCGADEDILDDDEEAEMTDTEEEDEYEDEITEKREKPRLKSAFIDEEAEETDEDVSNKVSQKDEEFDEDEEPEEKEDTVQEDSNDDQSTTIKKPLRRILKGFTEDSDEEENSQPMLESQTVEESDTGNKNTSFTSLNSTDSLEDDDHVPPNQPRTDKTPHREMTQSKTAVLGLLTPVQHLTGLQGFNSGSKFLRDSPVSPFLLPPDPSPFKDKNWNTDLQKKLFSNSCDGLDSEASMEDLAQLCSGKFPSPTQVTARADSAGSNSVAESLATQDVLSMCSGTFPDITPAAKDHQEKNFDDPLPVNEETNIETEVLTNKRPIMQVNLNSNEEIKSLDDDRLISELLDEEEMEQFKKRFESPIAPTLSNVNDYESEMEMEVKGGGRLISDSSDDEGEELKSKKNTKKLQQRLAFSDDSDSEDEDNKGGEEINLHDDCSDDEFGDIDTHTNKVIDYDSEENEIEFDNQEVLEVPRKRLKPSDFLENEAELSESDWDSADEDEKGLDALEVEQGDADVFDENKMRNDLEKIHMRRVLDQDTREIKILQELLLEDGELHGTGRQRQFRWKNIDDADNEDGQRDAEIEAYMDEEECEEQWRRKRHQREMFLKDKQEKQMVLENDDFLSTDSNSQVLKLGQEAVRKSLSAASTVPENLKTTTSSPEVKKPLMLLNTRGSFLARTDKFLSKLAEFTKDTTTSTVGPPKNTKKIVFQTVSQSTKETGIINNKRKLENADKTPKLIKKLRLSSNLTPVVKNVERKKKLFK